MIANPPLLLVSKHMRHSTRSDITCTVPVAKEPTDKLRERLASATPGLGLEVRAPLMHGGDLDAGRQGADNGALTGSAFRAFPELEDDSVSRKETVVRRSTEGDDGLCVEEPGPPVIMDGCQL